MLLIRTGPAAKQGLAYLYAAKFCISRNLPAARKRLENSHLQTP